LLDCFIYACIAIPILLGLLFKLVDYLNMVLRTMNLSFLILLWILDIIILFIYFFKDLHPLLIFLNLLHLINLIFLKIDLLILNIFLDLLKSIKLLNLKFLLILIRDVFLNILNVSMDILLILCINYLIFPDVYTLQLLN
jgi:hypothetical protein